MREEDAPGVEGGSSADDSSPRLQRRPRAISQSWLPCLPAAPVAEGLPSARLPPCLLRGSGDL